jgi:hypothetical protein
MENASLPQWKVSLHTHVEDVFGEMDSLASSLGGFFVVHEHLDTLTSLWLYATIVVAINDLKRLRLLSYGTNPISFTYNGWNE